MNIFDFFKQKFQLTDEIIELLLQGSSIKEFSKNEEVIKPNQYTKSVFFVESGFLKMYYLKDTKEITHYFFSENTFMSAAESVFYNKPSIYGVTTLEKSSVCAIPFQNIQKLSEQYIEVNKVIQQILLDTLIGFSNRLQNIQFETAQERYQNLLQQHPDILLRAPLGDIASYLGISQQTLSVIRSQIK